MKYKFSSFLNIDYSPLYDFVPEEEEIIKQELLDLCSGEVERTLFQAIKEIEFNKIGRDEDDDLYVT